YDTSTGAERWYQTISANYIVGNNGDFLDFLSVSPDGSTVAATGRRPESGIDDGFGHNRGDEWGTALLDSATGTVRWLQTYAGGLGYDYPHDVEFSPDGQTLVVSGEIQLVQGTFIAAVVAYHAADGTQVWAQRITPSSGGASFAPALTVDGSHAYVAMQWDEQGTAADYVTQSLSLADGTAQWTATYAQPGSDTPTAIVLAADGATVYVTGQSQQPLTDYDATTVAYRTDTGAERWVANYAGPGPMDNQADIDESIASARHGTRVAVAATSPSADGNTAAALLIYDVSSEVTPPAAVPELPLSPALFALASVLLVVVLRRRRHP
ncbi:MAG TPA: PQQ-binding-like beta-propeller repeat protein, partial [Candidatus Dormibacteraeota bacterium]|nr:PQQ-binding-like beta-propeller repeat protein [Candidatus Dormibacteraeota bacterium]